MSIACDAQSLVTSATCIECVPVGALWSLWIALACSKLNMNCDAQTLVTNAKCLYNCLPPGQQIPILISLLAQTAGVSLDPNTLAAGAKGLDQIPVGQQLPVLISLACQIVNKP